MSDEDITRLAGEPAAPSSAPASSRLRTSTSGWLSSSGSIDHGRFEPGAVLDGRYRIVGLVGKGGMGEVYRADDLRLGQQVALKVLPVHLAQDPVRLAQFHNEVRTARQVSHPNVCRMYDIGDVDSASAGAGHGQLFLTMEYVDGEDLSSLLRRIGRLPEDKALDIARQICLGLAAAHERGVLHRDLKPANIMLDGAGKVRIMDFSLAAIGEVKDVRAGTPAYMASEQLAGKEVTARSDLYALGLVLYELFTGRRAFDAKTIAALIEQHRANSITSPTELVKTLDASIERAILRCLEADPLRRPASALAVAASLPGGDPLAAAIAAGETPSPEMVAAAGTDESTLSPARGLGWAVACVALVVIMAALADRTTLVARVPLDRAASTLLDRARDLERQLGVTASAGDRAWGLAARPEVLSWVERTQTADAQTRVLAGGRPAAFVFWYRSSAQPMVPDGDAVGLADPINTQTAMTTTVLDTEGRLVGFQWMPPQLGDAGAAPPAAGVDAPALFAAAGLDSTMFKATAPSFRSRAYADRQAAFIGTEPDFPGVPLEVDIGWYLGRPVFFQVIGPWNRAATGSGGNAASSLIALVATVVVVPGMILGAALVARANLRRGRGDRKGAARLGGAVLIVSMARWLFLAHHLASADLEMARFFTGLGRALVDAGMVWLFYLAAEPQVRRIWPRILITWSRLLGGSFRDPMVGRDLVIGAACGVAMSVISYAFYLMPHWLPSVAVAPRLQNPSALLGAGYSIGVLFDTLSNALQNAMLGVLGLALLRLALLRVRLAKTWIIFSIATAIFSFLAARGQFQSGNWMLDMTFGVILVVIVLGVLFRLGLFAGIVAFFAHFWTYGLLVTLNPDRPYFTSGLLGLGVVAALAVVGFVLARGQQPLFGRVMAE